MDKLKIIADKFCFPGNILDIKEYGSGNINDTFQVVTDFKSNPKVILQKLNKTALPSPELIMENIATVTKHLRQRSTLEEPVRGRWETLTIYPTKNNKNYFVDQQKNLWRAVNFIPSTKSYQKVVNTWQAEEIGYAVGKFHRLISDLDISKLHDTMKFFHVTPYYIKRYNSVLKQKNPREESEKLKRCLEMAKKHKEGADILEKAKKQGEIIIRPIHGDPKVNNILFDKTTKKAVSFIDMDTLKPGVVHYDIGDCLRSACNPGGEETHNLEEVFFDLKLCQAVLKGYLSEAKTFFRDKDFSYIYDSVRLITFELSLRFLTDYLEGDIFFKTHYHEQNLNRALVQFKLLEDIKLKKNDIADIVDNNLEALLQFRTSRSLQDKK